MDKKKILVLGNGFLGAVFKRHGYTVLGRDEFEWSDTMNSPIQNPHAILGSFRQYDAVVNCIAKSDTRWCEYQSNFKELMSINAELPKYLSKTCHQTNTKFVQISTGCLYDTRGKGATDEEAFKSAHCNYVVSKWAGEGYLANDDLIIRPRLIFDSEVAQGRNNLLQKLPKFNNFLNEFNSVTSCDTIVEAVEALVEYDQCGVYNVANSGNYTIHEMATAMGLKGGKTTQEELHESQGLFLVNNVMDIDKLKKYYKPRDTIEEILRCYEKLQKRLASLSFV